MACGRRRDRAAVSHPARWLARSPPPGRRSGRCQLGFTQACGNPRALLRIGDRRQARAAQSHGERPALAEMTPGETNFARNVEHLLAKIDAPEYRHLTIEALVALGDFFSREFAFHSLRLSRPGRDHRTRRYGWPGFRTTREMPTRIKKPWPGNAFTRSLRSR